MPLDMIAEFSSFGVRPLKVSGDIDAADPDSMTPVVAYIEGHVDIMARRAENLRSLIAEISDALPDMTLFSNVIDNLERKAKTRAEELNSLQKTMLHRLSEEMGMPDRRAAVAVAASRIESAFEREIDLLSEMALFLRARRTALDPDARCGPTFDTVEGMEAYIRDSLVG